jgi:hypothetical protein
MHAPHCARWAVVLSPLWFAVAAVAQEPAPAAGGAAPASQPDSLSAGVGAAPSPEAPVTGVDSGTSAQPEFSPGFEGGLRLGIGLPLGNAGKGALGESRKLGDLAAYRAPIWVDIGYQATPASSYGVYGQIGFGGTGDACAGKCDWSDLRVGVQGQWRLNPGASADPWLGVGVGLESISFQSSELRQDDEGLFAARITERLLGPELLLQAGLELRAEDALQLGPYVAASIGSYLGDHYKCISERAIACPGGSSIDGSGFHTWLGIGVMGRYSP